MIRRSEIIEDVSTTYPGCICGGTGLVPTMPCVYFLFKNNDLIYIGSCSRLSARICGHNTTTPHDDYFFIGFKDRANAYAFEYKMIEKYNPSKNKRDNKLSSYGKGMLIRKERFLHSVRSKRAKAWDDLKIGDKILADTSTGYRYNFFLSPKVFVKRGNYFYRQS